MMAPTTSSDPGPTPPQPSSIDGKYQARRIDKLSRKCFPLAFVLFNVIYWIAYTKPTSPSDFGVPS
jgi:hypothetical protein